MPRDPNFKYQFVKVTLDNATNGQEFYEVRKPNNRKHTGTYIIGNDFWYDGDRHKQFITEDTIPLFVNARNDFYKKIESAKNEQDGYTAIKVAKYILAYKNLQQNLLYSFVIIGENYKTIFTKTVYDFLSYSYFILPTDSRQQEEINVLKMKNELIHSALTNQDLYLAFAIKECMDTITQQEADYLYSVDGNYRYVPEDKTYDIEDIEILGIRKGHFGFFNRTVYFYCDVKIKEKEYLAIWYPNDIKYKKEHTYVREDCNPNFLYLKTYKFSRKLNISDSVKHIIDNKAEQLI